MTKLDDSRLTNERDDECTIWTRQWMACEVQCHMQGVRLETFKETRLNRLLGPNVRKLSKIASILLARNYILQLQMQIEELKQAVRDEQHKNETCKCVLINKNLLMLIRFRSAWINAQINRSSDYCIWQYIAYKQYHEQQKSWLFQYSIAFIVIKNAGKWLFVGYVMISANLFIFHTYCSSDDQWA